MCPDISVKSSEDVYPSLECENTLNYLFILGGFKTNYSYLFMALKSAMVCKWPRRERSERRAGLLMMSLIGCCRPRGWHRCHINKVSINLSEAFCSQIAYFFLWLKAQRSICGVAISLPTALLTATSISAIVSGVFFATHVSSSRSWVMPWKARNSLLFESICGE